MPDSPDPQQLKRLLAAAGFEIFRVVGNRVHLADRVRDNLILDSGVAATAAPLGVRLVVRAPKSSFPSREDVEIFDEARRHAVGAVSQGYGESETAVVPVTDPGGGGETLETWYEVVFERRVDSHDELVDELRFALGVAKAAGGS